MATRRPGANSHGAAAVCSPWPAVSLQRCAGPCASVSRHQQGAELAALKREKKLRGSVMSRCCPAGRALRDRRVVRGSALIQLPRRSCAPMSRGTPMRSRRLAVAHAWGSVARENLPSRRVQLSTYIVAPRRRAVTSTARHRDPSTTIQDGCVKEGCVHSAVSSVLERPLVPPGLRKPAPSERGADLARHRRGTVRGG